MRSRALTLTCLLLCAWTPVRAQFRPRVDNFKPQQPQSQSPRQPALSPGLTTTQSPRPRLLSPGMIPRNAPELPSRQSIVQPTQQSPKMMQEQLSWINPRLVQLRYRDSRWILEGGGLRKDFGGRQQEAQQALRLIQGLSLDQRGVIGEPQPVMEYWLHRGKAPAGLVSGLRMIRIDPESLHVQSAQDQWFLRDKSRVLFHFGKSEQSARQAEAVIRKYGFDHIGIVGQAQPSMMIFLQRFSSQAISSSTLTEQNSLAQKPLSSRKRELAAQAERTKRSEKIPVAALLSSAVPQLREGSAPQGAKSLIVPRKESSLARYTHASNANFAKTSEQLVQRALFDWKQSRMVQEQGQWKVKVGSLEIANLGTDKRDAQVVESALAYYQLTERNQIGKAGKGPCYFLTMGSAPRGRMQGAFFEYFRPDQLEVQKRGLDYHLVYGRRSLLNCGGERKHVEHLIEVIQHYRFDHLCRIGSRDEHSLKFFVKAY